MVLFVELPDATPSTWQAYILVWLQRYGFTHPVSVLFDAATEQDAMSQMLWAAPNTMLVHDTTLPFQTKLRLILKSEDSEGIVFNLSKTPVQHFKNIARIIEFVPNDSAGKTRARETFKHYVSLGVKPQYERI